MHIYKGLQNKYFGNIVDTTHVLGKTMWFVMSGIAILFIAGLTMDILFTYRRNKMIYKQVSTVIWIVLTPLALATTLYVIIFGIISDSNKEQSQILIPYTFNRTFFYSVEGDAFYYQQLPDNYKQIVWPCIWEGSSLLSKYRMDNLLKISQGIDSDLYESIKIANQSNLSDIKTT
jgi:hypothetical protein